MATILNIETATTNCSVALAIDGKTMFLREDNSPSYSHAEVLHLFIKEVIAQSTFTLQDIHAVAVSKGPGSYTGLRIGVSAAKGLCFSLDKPLIAVNTLEILANQLHIESGYIIPLLDARRMEVYSSIYTSDLSIVRGVKAEIITPNSYIDFLDTDKTYFIGNGVKKTKEIIAHPNAIFVEDKWPSAGGMGSLAEHKYKISDTEDVAYFEPFYLKDFIALKKQS